MSRLSARWWIFASRLLAGISVVRDDNGVSHVESEDSGSGVPGYCDGRDELLLRRNSRERLCDDGLMVRRAFLYLSAEVVEGKRTVLEYLLSPVQRVTSEAAMER
jgi:hypothetical protein